MKEIKTLSDLEFVIKNNFDVYEIIRGRKYKLNYINLLQKKIIDIMSLIEEQSLFYENEY